MRINRHWGKFFRTVWSVVFAASLIAGISFVVQGQGDTANKAKKKPATTEPKKTGKPADKPDVKKPKQVKDTKNDRQQNDNSEVKPKDVPETIDPPKQPAKCNDGIARSFTSIKVNILSFKEEFLNGKSLIVKLEGGDTSPQASFDKGKAVIKKTDGKDIVICRSAEYKLVFYTKTEDNGEVLFKDIQIKKKGATDYSSEIALLSADITGNIDLEMNGEKKSDETVLLKIRVIRNNELYREKVNVFLLGDNETVNGPKFTDAEGECVFAYPVKSFKPTGYKVDYDNNQTLFGKISDSDRERKEVEVKLPPGATIESSFPSTYQISAVVAVILVIAALFFGWDYLPFKKKEKAALLTNANRTKNYDENFIPPHTETKNYNHTNKSATWVSPTGNENPKNESEPTPVVPEGPPAPPEEAVVSANEEKPSGASIQEPISYEPPPYVPKAPVRSNDEIVKDAYLELLRGNRISEPTIFLNISDEPDIGDSVFLTQIDNRRSPFILFTFNGRDGWVFPKPDVIPITHDSVLQRVFTDMTKDKFDRRKENLQPAFATKTSDSAGRECWQVKKTTLIA